MAENTYGPAFRWNPEDYRNSSPAQKTWAEELVRKLALTGNERVLDIGCGDGSITAGIARNLHEGNFQIVINVAPPGGLELHALKGRPKRLVDRRGH
ncbi:hypothetical protein [Methanoregula sp.]|uniref:hypothetical protein n=1 Tax=Methanoregula sp. TaxID=2052170 RepID=UPI003C16DEAF